MLLLKNEQHVGIYEYTDEFVFCLMWPVFGNIETHARFSSGLMSGGSNGSLPHSSYFIDGYNISLLMALLAFIFFFERSAYKSSFDVFSATILTFTCPLRDKDLWLACQS